MPHDDGRRPSHLAEDGVSTLPQGTRVDRYEIEQLIAAGGFGITYMARHVGLNKRVALKEHFPRGFASRDRSTHTVAATNSGTFEWTKERFLKEGEALTRCRHPGVVEALDVFEANGTAYMALGYEDGQSFGAWLKALGRFPTQAEIDRILAPLLEALAYVHQQDMLHRDLAPDNIIIRRDGTPVLIDFGAARQAIAQRSQIMSAIVKGGFSPPEQYTTTGKAQGPWSDIYALGATLHYALSARMVEESTSRTVEDSYRPIGETLGERAKDYRPGFLTAIDRALNLQRADRPSEVVAWRAALFADEIQSAGATLSTMATVPIAHAKPDRATPAAGPSKTPPPPNTGAQTRPWLLIGAGGLAATVLGAFMMARAFHAPSPPAGPQPNPQANAQPGTIPPTDRPPVQPPGSVAPPVRQSSADDDARRRQIADLELAERKASAERRIAEDRAAQLKAEADAKKLADAKAAEQDADACGRLPEDMCAANANCTWIKPTVFIEGRPVWPARCAPKGTKSGGLRFENGKRVDPVKVQEDKDRRQLGEAAAAIQRSFASNARFCTSFDRWTCIQQPQCSWSAKAGTDGNSGMCQAKALDERATSPASPSPTTPGPQGSTPGDGRPFRDCDTCPELVLVPAGTFLMGSPTSEKGRTIPEGPQQTVTIKRPFAVGRASITVGEFKAFVAETNHQIPRGCRAWNRTKFDDMPHRTWERPGFGQSDAHPVVCVSWYDAKAFTEWLSRKTGHRYRLPSEAEREYVGRAGSSRSRWWGDIAADGDLTVAVAGTYGQVTSADRARATSLAISARPNGWGLYHVLGNVGNWVEDCWNESLAGTPPDGSARITGECARRVARGGSWIDDPNSVRSALRSSLAADGRNNLIGLRVVRDIAD